MLIQVTPVITIRPPPSLPLSLPSFPRSSSNNGTRKRTKIKNKDPQPPPPRPRPKKRKTKATMNKNPPTNPHPEGRYDPPPPPDHPCPRNPPLLNLSTIYNVACHTSLHSPPALFLPRCPAPHSPVHSPLIISAHLPAGHVPAARLPPTHLPASHLPVSTSPSRLPPQVAGYFHLEGYTPPPTPPAANLSSIYYMHPFRATVHGSSSSRPSFHGHVFRAPHRLP